MKGVFIIPTGLGCTIGGHAGDATPAAKLIASICDELIVNPNVVNASDINEMSPNMLYVEGSILDRFLRGEINLKKVRGNKILLVVNPPVDNNTINAVSACRATLGADIEILELETPLRMIADKKSNGKASGTVTGWDDLIEQLCDYKYDALAIQTLIEVDNDVAQDYMNNPQGINPWGGIEAKASKLIANGIDKPIAHAPLENPNGIFKNFNQVVEPEKSAETVSVCYLHCVLKGLHKAPRISYSERGTLSAEDIDFLITPYGCWDEPHWACEKLGIPIIQVLNNSALGYNHPTKNENLFTVDNYVEAVGIIQLLKEGISIESLIRPMKNTKVFKVDKKEACCE